MKLRRPHRLDPNTILLLKQVGVGIFFFLLLGLVLTSIWFFTRLEFFTISTIEVEGGETISSDVVRTAAEQTLTGSYIKFIPYRFTWFYPKDDVVTAVNAIDRVYNAELEVEHRTTLRITFDEYLPAALWCPEGVSVSEETCLFLDDRGFAFAPAPRLTGASFVRFVTIGTPPAVDTFALAEADMASAQSLIRLLDESGWYIEVVEADAVSDAFLFVEGGGQFIVSLLASPEETISNLETILSSEEFAHIAPGNFEYIDLRFGNKVFVNESTPDVAVSSSSASSSDEIFTTTVAE